MSAGTETPPRTAPRHLQLVASQVEAPPDDRRVRDAINLPPSARALRRAVQAAGLANGSPVDGDSLSVLLAAKVANHASPITLFTEEIVWQLLWVDVFGWCATRRIDVPLDIAETLWTVLSHLARTDQLHPSSDSLDQLRSPLMTCGGLGPDGAVRHPTGRRNA